MDEIDLDFFNAGLEFVFKVEGLLVKFICIFNIFLGVKA